MNGQRGVAPRVGEAREGSAVEFRGFQPVDFELFAIPDFSGRMAALREHLKPKLIELGADLRGPIEEATGVPTFPHVAQHLRRRVNPPERTWVAFARQKNGYKRWTHYRVSVGGDSVRLSVFVEDDADDKAPFGGYLTENAPTLLKALRDTPISWLTLTEDRPVPHSEITTQTLTELGARLQRRKLLKFEAGVVLKPEEACALTPAKFEEWAMAQVEALRPLYLAGWSDPGEKE